MEFLGSLIGPIVSGGASGGILGIGLGLVSSVIKIWGDSRKAAAERRFRAEEHTRALDLREMELAAGRAETENELAIAQEAAREAGMRASYEDQIRRRQDGAVAMGGHRADTLPAVPDHASPGDRGVDVRGPVGGPRGRRRHAEGPRRRDRHGPRPIYRDLGGVSRLDRRHVVVRRARLPARRGQVGRAR